MAVSVAGAPELVSPELALVCPELGARARALLPERPWELVGGTSPRTREPAAHTLASGSATRRRSRTPGRISAAIACGLVLGVTAAGSLPLADEPILEAASTAVSPRPAAPNSGYTDGGGVIFRTDGAGSTLLDLTVVTGCGRAYAPGPVPVSADGSFATRFGTSPVVELRGRFGPPHVAAGTVTGSAAGCEFGAPFSASVS